MAITSLTRNSIQNPNKYTDLLAGNSVYEVSSLVPIATVVASGSVAGITFSSIPQTYQDLMLSISMRSSQAATNPQFYVYENGDQSTNRGRTVMRGDGATASTFAENNSPFIASGAITGASSTAGVFASAVVHYLNYANTSYHKTSIVRTTSDQNGSGRTEFQVKLWPSTSAISSMTIYNDGNNNWVAGSTFSLFGIKAVGQ